MPSSSLPGTRSGAGRSSSPIWPCSGWGLPCHSCYQERGALLPHRFTLACALAGHRRSALCCTFRRLATPGRYPAPCPVELGLSSSGRAARDPHSPPGLSNTTVPRRGLEPPRRFRHQILSLACLPVSAPGPHTCSTDSAPERTRTSTSLRPLDPESSASTNSATGAVLPVRPERFELPTF